MSIFSRLFKGPEDGDKDPSEEDAVAAESRPGERARKAPPDHARAPADSAKNGRSGSPPADGLKSGRSGSSPADGKGSMRPMAPSFQIHPPASERGVQAAIMATPVVQVGGPESRPGGGAPQRAATGARGAQAQVAPATETTGARNKNPSAATVRLGSNSGAMAPGSPPPAPAGKPSSGAQRAAPPPLPPGAVGRPSPPASPAAPHSKGSRPKLPAGAAALDGLKAPPAQRRPPADDSVDGLLELELGASPSSHPVADAPPKRGAITAQGLAPAAQAAVARAAAGPDASTGFEHEANLQNDLDAAFGAMVEAPNGAARRPAPLEPPPSGASVSELRDLFASLAANHMRQVREFMIGVKWGEAPLDWVPICEPAVASLLRAAREMELDDLCAALDAYREALGRAASAAGTTIGESTRESLMSAYARLAELMPEAFGLDGERGRRETIIVHALLQQVPEVRKITIDKIYAAGLTNLDNLFVARPDEISATTGIAENLASRIVEKFQRYRREITSLADSTRAAERKRLGELAAELRALHEDFERASGGWSDDERAEKKKFRQARAEALLQVKVLLARLGEIDRLGQIERQPFGRKIETLEQYLREAKTKEASTP